MPGPTLQRPAPWTAPPFRAPRPATPPIPPVTFPTTALAPKAFMAVNANLRNDWRTWDWRDITEYVRWDPGVSTSSGRRDQADLVEPSWARAVLENTDGRFTRRNPTGPYYGQLAKSPPIRFGLDPGSGYTDRYFGFITELPRRWDRTGLDATVNVVCGGPLRWLQQQKTKLGALQRTIQADNPTDFWTMEDGIGSTTAASAIGGLPLTASRGTPLFGSVASPAGVDGLLCSLPQASLSVGSLAASSSTAWTAEIIFQVPDSTLSDGILIELTTSVGRWDIYPQWLTNPVLVAANPIQAGSVSLVMQGTLDARFDDVWHHMMVKAYEVAGTTFAELWYDGVLVASTSAVGTLGAPVRPRVNVGYGTMATTNTLNVYAGYLVFYSSTDVDAAAHYQAMLAYVGELTHIRQARVAAEARINMYCQATTSTPLGAQPFGTELEVFRDAELGDGGVLYEHEFGVGYLALSERYNKAVVLELDFDAGQITEDPEPDDSDLRYRNRWTAARPGGSTETVDIQGGIPATELVRDDKDDFNVESDDLLKHVAGWLVHRDTVDEDFWPNLSINLAKNPELIPAWLALPYGARVTAADPYTLAQAATDLVNIVVEGRTEHWNSLQWSGTFNAAPASTYEVGVYDYAGPTKRYNSRYTYLGEDLDPTETGVDVTVTAGKVGWITTTGQPSKFPFLIVVGGEVMRVNGCVNNGGGSYTFTVERSVNLIVKSHTADGSTLAQVRVYQPAVYAR